MCSPVWSPQKGSQSYIEKRRGRKEIEVTRRRKGGIKRREKYLARNQFPVFFSAWNTHRDSQSLVEKRRGREEIEVTWGRKRRFKGGESNQASNHTPK